MKLLFMKGLIAPEIIQAICWTLLHSLWLGLLAAAIAAVVIIATRKSKAAVRYNLLSFIFIGFILSSLVTFLYQPGIIPSLQQHDTTVHFIKPPVIHVVNEAAANTWLAPLQKETFFQTIIYYGNKYATFITGVWALLFFLNFIKLLAGLHYVHRIRSHQTSMPGDIWKQRLNEMKNTLGIRDMVSFMESGLIKVPVVIGYLKPVILVPIGMLSQLSPPQVETILLHELAHIRRRDFAVNLLQRFAECIFFFNPFIVWISSRIREEREACCDDIVMEHTSNKRSYLEALVSFRQPDFMVQGHAMALGRNNNLLNRVKRIITQENRKLNAMEKLTLMFVLIAVTAFSFMPDKNNTIKPVHSRSQPAADIPVKESQPVTPIIIAVKKSTAKHTTDTVPSKKLKFNNISSVINDDGTTKTATVTAKASDGKTYSYRLENSELVELAIDGVKVKKENFERYSSLIDEIEKGRNESMRLAMKQQQLDIKKTVALQNLQLAKEHKLQLLHENNLQLANVNQDRQVALKLQLAMLDSLHQRKYEPDVNLQHKLLTVHKNVLMLSPNYQLHDSNNQLSSIITDLADAGVLQDKTNLSFILNHSELIVNGKKQDTDLHEKLRKKYIKNKNDHYKYSVKGNSRSTDIYVE